MDPASSPLLQRFAEIVRDGLSANAGAYPVLDVGCGSGTLLEVLSKLGVGGIGVEIAAQQRCESTIPILAASAEHLPLRDGTFDTVCLRHVPHHLERPAPCFAEAWRLARRRLIVAEPYFDPGLPGQAAGLAADRMLKAMDRARGVYHGECLSASEIHGLVPAQGATLRVESLLPLDPWPAKELERRREQAQGSTRLTLHGNQEWLSLLEQARGQDVTRSGTIILQFTRNSSGVSPRIPNA